MIRPTRAEPPPEGFGGRDPFTQADAGCPAGQVCAITCTASQCLRWRRSAQGHVRFSPTPLRSPYRILDLGVAAMISLQFGHLLGGSRSVHEAVDSCRWRRGRAVRNRSVGFTRRTMSRTGAASASLPGGGIGGFGQIGGAVHPVGNRRPVLPGHRPRSTQAFGWKDGGTEADTHFA